MLTVVTICTGKYTAEYIQRMELQLRQHLRCEFKTQCITTKANQIEGAPFCPDIVTRPDQVWESWWDKLMIFGPQGPVEGHALYLDLDQIILGDISHWLLPAPSKEMVCYADHKEWCGEKFGSALMYFEAGRFAWLWEKFLQEEPWKVQREGGDQIWIGEKLREAQTPVNYINEAHPGEIVSYRYDLHQGAPSAGVKLVNFHGRPKPAELKHIEWIRENWGRDYD